MTPADFNLRHLRALAATLRLGSFSAAAKTLGISQPAVTQAVGKVETLAGLRLVNRDAGNVSATDAGTLLAARSEAADAALAEPFSSARRGGIGGRAGAEADISMAQVTAFLALAERGSYAAGAAALEIAQPSLHRSVGTLEELCGVPLVARQGRSTMLTPAGERLASAFRLAMTELQAGVDELAVLAGRDQGAVRIGAHPVALARAVPAAIARFLSEHPPVVIDVQPAGLADDADRLRDGRLDALLTFASDALRDGFATENLWRDPLVIAARRGHPLAAGSAPGLVRLATFGWGLPPSGADERQAWERMFMDGGLYPPTPNVTLASPAALLDLVFRSDLLTIASQAAVESSGGAVVPVGAPLGEERQLVLATRRNWAPTPAQAVFLEEIRAGARARLAF